MAGEQQPNLCYKLCISSDNPLHSHKWSPVKSSSQQGYSTHSSVSRGRANTLSYLAVPHEKRRPSKKDWSCSQLQYPKSSKPLPPLATPLQELILSLMLSTSCSSWPLWPCRNLARLRSFNWMMIYRTWSKAMVDNVSTRTDPWNHLAPNCKEVMRLLGVWLPVNLFKLCSVLPH